MTRAPDPLAQLTRSLLPGVPKEQARELLDRMERMELKAGTRVIREGEVSDALYFVHIGGLEVTAIGPDGPLHLAFVGPEHWVGEVSVIDRGVASATVTAAAAAPTVLLRLDHQALLDLRESHPALAASLLRTLSLDMVKRIRSSTDFLLARLGVGREEEKDEGGRLEWFSGALRRLFRRAETSP